MVALDIKGVSFSYDKQIVLENINLQINKRDFFAIIGPNGGGKSSLLKLIVGINKLQKGSILAFGKPSYKNLSIIGYVPQNTNINIDFPIKVIDVVLMGYKSKKRAFLGYSQDEIKIVKDSLNKVGMEDFIDTKIKNLSGGQRQRVLIARALCSNPKILILDEPTASIDTNGQKQIYDLLKKLNKTITIIIVTHDLSVIMEYANKVAYINKSAILHDIENKIIKDKEHFCEVELLNMLGSKR